MEKGRAATNGKSLKQVRFKLEDRGRRCFIHWNKLPREEFLLLAIIFKLRLDAFLEDMHELKPAYGARRGGTGLGVGERGNVLA